MVLFCDRPFQNISEFDGHDDCGSNSWMMVEVDMPQDQNRNPGVLLPGLKPVTQYAVFLKTVNLVVDDIDTPVLGAKSELVYILTKPKGKEGMQTLLQNDIVVCEMVFLTFGNTHPHPPFFLFLKFTYLVIYFFIASFSTYNACWYPRLLQFVHKPDGSVVSSCFSRRASYLLSAALATTERRPWALPAQLLL